MQKMRGWREKRKERNKKANDEQAARSTRTESQQSAPAERGEDGHENWGMHVLVPNKEAHVDIVALHGLNGHYRKTWTKSLAAGERNWLEDFLPEQIPEARIMSYGYNSTVHFSKSVADIGTFAEQLLYSLIAKRRNIVERARPIIFICHSLGGLVFKQGLVRARERDQFDALLRKIRGVAFFGTPHRGSSLATWGAMFANILSTASLGSSTNSQLSADLQERSIVLQSISKSFVDRSKSLNIISFYETEKADWINCRVVEEQSAVLGLPDELAIPIDGNHQTICKFSSKDDERYQVVWTNLQDLVQKCLVQGGRDTILSPEEQRDCARCFHKSSSYESYRTLNPERAPNTCEWVLQHDEYGRWQKYLETAFLWMTADAGCGKSVLSSFLVDHLRSEFSGPEMPALVCHFFLKDNSAQGDAINALCAILHQIFIDSPGLLQYAFREYETQGSAFVESFDALWRILFSVLQDKVRKGIFLVLDGLDECMNPTKTRLIQSIVNLYESFTQPLDPHQERDGSTVRKLPFLKLFMTSRPDNAIKEAFRKIPRLRGENEIEAISHDIGLVVRYSLEELSIPRHFKPEVQTKLIEGADQTHLWTSLILKLLKDALIDAVSESDIHSILDSRDIYDLYNHMLRKSSNSVQARKLLQILLAAARPLTLEEMNVALAVTSPNQTLASTTSALKHPAENYIFSLCRHFIRIIRSKVYLVHQTAKEFLTVESETHSHSRVTQNRTPHISEVEIEVVWQSSISMKESNKALFSICMSRLAMLQINVASSDEVCHSPEEEYSLYKKCCVDYPLFGYAAQFWPNHYIAFEIDPESVFSTQNEHLCDTRYEESYSCLDPYFRAWTVLTRNLNTELARSELEAVVVDTSCNNRTSIGTVTGAGKSDPTMLMPTRDITLVRSELEAIALHILSNDSVSVQKRERRGKTALHLAVISRSVALVEVLLGRKVPIDARDFEGFTPLSLSFETGDDANAITMALLASGANVNVPNNSLSTPLHRVAEHGTVDQIALLSRNEKANVSLRDGHGETPLQKIIRRPTMEPSAVAGFHI